MTENKVVPKLRFGGFEDEWKIEPIGHFINLLSGMQLREMIFQMIIKEYLYLEESI